MQGQYIAACDIGSTQIAAALARISPARTLEVVGMTTTPTLGIKHGGITNMQDAVSSIATVATQLTRITGMPLPPVYLSLSGEHLQSVNHRGSLFITPANRDIAVEDVYQVNQIAGAVPLEANRLLLSVVPRTYGIDGTGGISDPVGMSGHQLEVDAHLITCITSHYQNVLKCAQRAGLTVEDIVPAALASAEAVLAPGECENGVVLLDIGGGTTDIVLYADGGVWRTSVLPYGGDLITSDLTYALKLPLPIVEAIKTTYGCALPSRVPAGETIDLSQFLPNWNDRVDRREVATIIHTHTRKLLSLIREEIVRAGRERIFMGGVVLTGGTAELPGLTELAASVFDAPVRIGLPHSLYGQTDGLHAPANATLVGLLRVQEKAYYQSLDQQSTSRWAWLRHLQAWFQGLIGSANQKESVL